METAALIPESGDHNIRGDRALLRSTTNHQALATHQMTPQLFLPPPPFNPHHRHFSPDSPSHQQQYHHQQPPVILHDHDSIANSATATVYSSMDTNDAYACSLKAKIMAHPHYHRLLKSYLNCQKVGAPAEVVGRLDEACTAAQAAAVGGGGYIGEDPHLDQFMEAYCEMLTKYEQELTKPFREATLFLTRAESQFKALTLSSSSSSADHSVCGEGTDWHGSSGEEDTISNNCGNYNNNNRFIVPLANDNELKVQLLRKYSGYLGSLRQEFMKKRKKGRLPKEAREQLLEWWITHYNWPYPSESQKVALAESTGLDQKQINNWFINQRKRHWKPSEDMQLAAMDAHNHHRHLYLQPQHGHYYMDSFLSGNPFSMDLSSSLL